MESKPMETSQEERHRPPKRKMPDPTGQKEQLFIEPNIHFEKYSSESKN